jgi:hypothetical protein
MVLVSFSGVIIKDLTPIADVESDGTSHCAALADAPSHFGIPHADFQPPFSAAAIVFQEFVNFALGNIFGQKTANKVYNRVAASLSIEPEAVQKAVVAVAAVLVESAKKNASEDDFVASVSDLRLSVANAEAIASAYSANHATLREYLSSSSMQLPSYADLDWRLDVEVSSRALREQIKPMFLLELQTSAGGSAAAQHLGEGVSRQYLQSDWANLQHIADELTKAVAEAKSGHARRIMRYVK